MPRHLVHSLLEREHALLHDVFFNEPRECAVHARVDTPAAGVRRIRNDARERRAQDIFHVFFVRDVVDHPRIALFRRQQVKERIERVFLKRPRDLGDALSLKSAVFVRPEADSYYIVKADEQRDVLKVAARLHPRAHFLSRSIVEQALGQRLRAALLEFRRQHVDKLCRARSVGVHVAHDVKPVLPRLFNEREHFRHGLSRVAPSDGLEMADLQRRLQRAGDLEHFAQRIDDAVALLPHVDTDGHAAPVQRRERADEPVGRVKDLRRVAKAERHAARAVGQRRFHVIVQIAQLER